MAHSSRNSILAGGISKLSRSAVYKKKALYKRKKQAAVKAASVAATATITKPVGGDNNGGSREVLVKKAPRYYPTEDQKKPLVTRKKPKMCKLRASITPGTVLILLAGRHKGKRVVFLKQLPSGLLLVTGPYKINGVPLRRVPQSYVISTSVKLDISNVNLPESVSEGLFAREKKQKKSSENMFEEDKQGFAPSEERKSAQQSVDEQILPEISKQEHLAKYLKSLCI